MRRGAGRPLLLIHGLGSSWRSWSPILPALEAEREVVAVDLPGFGETPAPAGDGALRSLVHGPPQAGMPAGAARGPIVIGWGRRDLVCLPSQAARAIERFPDARLHWFERCGHFPQWDVPEHTSRLILDTTDGAVIPTDAAHPAHPEQAA